MIRAALFVALVLWLSLASALAQPALPLPPSPAMPAEQAALALEVLNDPAKRAQVTATLEAIIRAQGRAPTDARTAPSPAAVSADSIVPLAPDSLGAQLLVSASAAVTTLGAEARAAINAIRSVPLLWGWIETMLTSPSAQDFLLDVFWRVLIAAGLATTLQRFSRHLLRGPIDRLEALGWPATAKTGEAAEASAPDPTARAEAGDIEPPPRHARGSAVLQSLHRVPRLSARLGLELIPVLATALAGYIVVAAGLGGQNRSQLIILAVINAYALCTAILRFSHVLVPPSVFAVITLDVESARDLMVWIRRLVVGAIVVYVFGEVGFLLGMSPIAHAALQKAVGLYVVGVALIVGARHRVAIGAWMSAPDDAAGSLSSLRNRVSRNWHWLAGVILLGGWLGWALERPDREESFLHVIALTIVIILLSRLGQLTLHGLLDKALITADVKRQDDILGRRLRAYHRVFHRCLSLFVNSVTALFLLHIYNVGALPWLLTTPLGRRVLSAIGTILLTIAAALLVWELVNAAIQRHVNELERDAQPNRSARLRTLLPLLRTSLIVAIAVVSGLMVLSEIGVNIAPLLAGAGIVGIAVGFGSQRLVQDLITGVFLLLENAMQVGDVIKVGELVGTVESLSVRTIRIRSDDGSVHIIPFGSVSTVTNMTREFSRAVLQVTVGYGADYDKVVAVLRDIVTGMRAEPRWDAIIEDDLELLGLDRVDGGVLTIRARIKCAAFGRWSVGREFNRRMRERFDAEGIELPATPRPP
jgi:small-conductance mechanosensitive channel